MSDNVEKDFNEVITSETPMMDKLKKETTVFMDPCKETFFDKIKKLISGTTRYEFNLSKQSDTHQEILR